MFSFLKKTFTKKKTPPDVFPPSLAEDALETKLAKPNVEPKKCVTSEAFVRYSEKQPITAILVQGSSDSKPNNPPAQSPSASERFTRTYHMRKDLLVNKRPEQEITKMQYVRRASKATSSDIYPNLDQIRNVQEKVLSLKPKVVKVKEQKTIHDVAKEICFMIEPRILNVATSKDKLNRLKEDTQKNVLIIHNMIKNLSKSEYTFKTELDFRQTYSDRKVYNKLHSFNDVKKFQRFLKAMRNKKKIFNRENPTPVFQSYRSSLRCYKGKNCDIIYCD